MSKIVLLDCDGPLSDLHYAMLRWLRVEFPEFMATHRIEPHHWYVQDSLPEPHKEALNVASAAPGFCAALNPTDGALEAVAHLIDRHDLHIVTAPWPKSLTWAGEREQWLLRHFGLKHDRVTQTHAKHLVYGDLLIDDKPSTLVKWQERHPNGHALLWRAEWNTPHHAMRGADNWPDMLRLVQELLCD